MNAPGARSKLTVVVAVDLAGYAAMTETDQQAAVAEAAGLRQQVAALALTHGGRLFHAAGDGFMAEFGSASAALDFARELGEAAHAPIRIGVHLGEVAETAEGDLLGHGVNVAARLQAQARPGQALISADVRRALPGGQADKLKRVGVIRLDKMSQRIETFALGEALAPKRGRLPRASPLLAAGVALGLVAAMGLSWPWIGDQLAPRDRGLVALEAFDASAAPAAPKGYAGELRDEMVGELTRNDLGVTSGSASPFQAKPAYLVTGGVRQEGGALRVDVRVDDARQAVSLWSGRFEAPVGETRELRQQVAVNVTDVLKCARVNAPEKADLETIRIYLKLCERGSGEGVSSSTIETRLQLAERLVARAPDFAGAHGLLALMNAYAARLGRPQDAGPLLAKAREEANRALALNPRSVEAYGALTVMHPRRDWGQRGIWLRKEVELEPTNATAQAALGNFLAEVGWVNEATATRNRAFSLDPLSPGRTVAVAYHLAQQGAQSEAEAMAERATAAWPTYRGAWQARVRILIWGGDFAGAKALLAERAAIPGVEDADLASWRELVEAWSRAAALPQGPARAPWIARLVRIAERRGVLSDDAVQAVAAVGGADQALPLLTQRMGEPSALTLILFNPPVHGLQSDPRFMDLAAKLGLAQYWLATGKMPDFCARGLPYDCAAEARRAVKAPGAMSLAAM